MLYLQIVIWTLLVILGISYIATLITPLNTAEKDAKISYLYLLSCVLSSAIFVLLKELFLIDTAVFVWKILSIIPLCLILIICFFYKRKSVNNIFSFLGVLLLGIIPFLINLNITPSEVLLPSLKNTYSLDVIIISFVAFAAILLYMVARLLIRKNRTILESIEYLSNIVKDAENLNSSRIESFRSPYEKMLLEELTSVTNDFRRTLHKTSLDLRTLTDVSSIVRQGNNKQYDDVRPLFYEIKGEIEELKDAFVTFSSYKDSKFDIAGFNNLDIIRELNHFLATPFSSIVTNGELLRKQILQKKNITSATLYIDRIISSVHLCQCVIKAYREITQVSNSFVDSSQTIKQGLSAAFDLFQLEYAKPNLNFQIEANDTVPGYSNNLIISLMSPLLQNAVCASPDYGFIEVAIKEQGSFYSITITNICIDKPDAKLLNTVGYSSKENHTGTGLLIVRHLLQLRKSGELNFEISDNKITFEIKLNKIYDK